LTNYNCFVLKQYLHTANLAC